MCNDHTRIVFLQKLQKLLALAGNNPSQAEAESALKKAQELATLHKIDLALLATSTNEVDDLVEMSCCHSNINSSSTFSWWSAWLNRNPDKVIITQEKWFQDGWMNMNTEDIIPSNWHKL